MSALRRLAEWALALAVLFLPMLITYWRERGTHASSYALGAAFATGLLIVVAAIGIRAAHRRLSGRAVAAPAPAFVAVVAVLAIGVQYVVRAADDGGGDVERINTAAHACQAADPHPYGDPPAGTQLLGMDPAQRAQFQAQVASSAPQGLDVDAYEIARVVESGRVRGVIVAYPGVGDSGERADFEDGMFASVGARPVADRVNGVDVSMGQGPQAGIVSAAQGCWIVAVAAPSLADAGRIATPILSP